MFIPFLRSCVFHMLGLCMCNTKLMSTMGHPPSRPISIGCIPIYGSWSKFLYPGSVIFAKKNLLSPNFRLPAFIFRRSTLYLRVDLNQRSLKLSLTVHKRRSVGTETAPFLVAWSLSQSTYGTYICTSCTVRVAALPFAPPMWTATICSDHTRKFRDVSAT